MVDLEFFSKNGYVRLENTFSKEELNRYIKLYNRDRADRRYFWRPIGFRGHQDVNCEPLISTPEFDELIRHPRLIEAVETLFEAHGLT